MTETDPLEMRLGDSDLPTAIKEHLVRCIHEGKRHRWHQELEENFDQVVTSTNTIVDSACRNTGRDRDSLLRDTDFDPNDLDPDRLDAAISELRGINHLRHQGFQNIRLLRAQPGTRTADLVAARGGQKYALDVACSSAGAARTVEALAGYMLDVCRLKETQLNNTKETNRCRYRGLLFVVNSRPAVVFGCQPLYRRAAKQVYEGLGAPADYFVAVMTGQIALVAGGEADSFQGPDDVVYPDWPAED
jgi:hypothetical protein